MVGFSLNRNAYGFCVCAFVAKVGVVTDLEFYELRYSGKQAAFLRGFRALYLGGF